MGSDGNKWPAIHAIASDWAFAAVVIVFLLLAFGQCESQRWLDRMYPPQQQQETKGQTDG